MDLRITFMLAALAAFTGHGQAQGLGNLVPAAAVCVDSVAGNDSNTGTCQPYAPWQTITKLNTYLQTASAGTASGITGSFQGQFIQVSNINNLGFVGYGATQPVIDCSAVIPNVNFTLSSGSTYQATVSTQASTLGWFRVWENGTGFTRGGSSSTLSNSQYFPSGDPTGSPSTGPYTLYVQTSDGSSPITNGRTYTYNQNGCITVIASGTRFINLHCKNNLNNNGCLDAHGDNQIISFLIAENGTKHNVYIGQNSYIWQSTAHNAYYGGIGSDLFVYNDNTPTGLPVTFDHVAAYLDSFDFTVGAIFGHANVSGTFGAVTCIACSSSNTNGIEFGSSTSEVYVGGTVDNISAQGPTVITGTAFVCRTSCLQIFGSPVTVTGASMTGATSVVVQDFTGTSTISLLGPNCVLTGPVFAGYIILQSTAGTGVTLNVNGCTIMGSSANVYDLQSGYHLSSDNNAFSQNGLNFILGASSWNTFTAYQAATGQDTHSTF